MSDNGCQLNVFLSLNLLLHGESVLPYANIPLQQAFPQFTMVS
jgi:hypothetical protein